MAPGRGGLCRICPQLGTLLPRQFGFSVLIQELIVLIDFYGAVAEGDVFTASDGSLQMQVRQFLCCIPDFAILHQSLRRPITQYRSKFLLGKDDGAGFSLTERESVLAYNGGRSDNCAVCLLAKMLDGIAERDYQAVVEPIDLKCIHSELKSLLVKTAVAALRSFRRGDGLKRQF